MSSYTNSIVAHFDTLRSIAHGSISGSYAAIGSALTYPARIVKITNNTDGDMLISTDGINDMDFIPAHGFALYDLCTNQSLNGGSLQFPVGTVVSVKQSTAPTVGSVYLTVIYAL